MPLAKHMFAARLCSVHAKRMGEALRQSTNLPLKSRSTSGLHDALCVTRL